MAAQRCILLTVTAIVCSAGPARAQWVVAPYLGINLAGDAEFRRGGLGLSVAYFIGRVGFEFDVERYNHFYKDVNVTGLVRNNCGVGPASEPCVDLNTDAIGYMGKYRRADSIHGRAEMAPLRRRGARRDSLVAHGSLARCRRHQPEQPRI
jgi:hypothetical protein